MNKFNNKEEYLNYLKEYFKAYKEECNIFIHEVFLQNATEQQNGAYHKAKQIIDTGLDISKYATIFGTLTLVGSTKSLDINKILNYSYSGNKKITTVVFAIPKNIDISGKKLDFSSLNLIDESLCNQIKHNKIPTSQFVMHNILDVTKGTGRLPKQFAIFYQNVDLLNDNYEIELQQNTYNNLTNSQKDELLLPYKEKFLQVLLNSKAKNMQELYIEQSNKWHKENDLSLADDI